MNLTQMRNITEKLNSVLMQTFATQAEFAAWLMRIFDIWNTMPLLRLRQKNTFASQVILYLEEYFREKIKVDDIANALNTSYRTLIRKFSSETGISLSEKLTDIRLNHTTQLLISTDLSIYNIAINSGFDNEFYFSKRFKQKENMPPKTYRLLHKLEK